MNKRTNSWIPILIFLLAIGILFIWLTRQEKSPASPVTDSASITPSSSSPGRVLPRATARAEAPVTPNARTNAYLALKPQSMRLDQKVLLKKKWNDGPDAFGLDKPPGGEGARIGPAAVAFLNGNIYLLDNPNKRVLGFDQAGNRISSAPLTNTVASDLSVDASGTSLVLVDHMNNTVYRVDGNETTLLATASIKDDYPLGTRFSYDPASDSLSASMGTEDQAAIDGNNVVLKLSKDNQLGIAFDKPVACVEEVMTDAKGIVWVLFTLEGDYRMRRVARVDPVNGSAGVAEVDVWFDFDATRHMAATQNGVVIFAGDREEGRLVSFDYQGAF